MAARALRPQRAAKLSDAIAVVEGVLASIGEPPSFSMDGWAERERAFRESERKALDLLVRVHGATHGSACGSYRLRFAGVQSTCSSGPSGLLRNWIQAARRRLEGGAS